MTLSMARSNVVLRQAGPRASVLVTAGWYCALIGFFGVYLSTLSDAVPAGCEVCDSDRSGMLMFGLYIGLPALFLALLASLVTLWLVTVRVRVRSAAVAGTLAAVPALVAFGVLGGIAMQ
ncbi:hypothetical protein JNW90_25710 [Micromonospora sp. STR1s_5]|nr:hypothetical protein [Micromonospora sp. STR1s_5]